MKKIISSVSISTLSAIWKFFVYNRQEDLKDLEIFLERAKALIFIFHPDDETAESLLIEIGERLSVYSPPKYTRGSGPDPIKIPLQGGQILQSFVFEVLEQSERLQEDIWRLKASGNDDGVAERVDSCQFSPYLIERLLSFPTFGDSLDQFGMTARYLKKLTQATYDSFNLKRVVSGVPRLAYKYSTKEMEILSQRLDGRIQGDGFKKATSKIRGELIEILLERFGDFLILEKDRAFDGERCFKGQTIQQIGEQKTNKELALFAHRCMGELAPWSIASPRQGKNESLTENIRKVAFSLLAGDAGQAQFLLNHSILTPDIFEKLVVEVLPEPTPGSFFEDVRPQSRFSIPCFFTPELPNQSLGTKSMGDQNRKQWHWRFAPSPPQGDLVSRAMERNRVRRSNFNSGFLEIVHDGKVIAKFHTSLTEQSLVFPLRGNFIEVFAWDSEGRFPFAVFCVAEFWSQESKTIEAGFDILFFDNRKIRFFLQSGALEGKPGIRLKLNPRLEGARLLSGLVFGFRNRYGVAASLLVIIGILSLVWIYFSEKPEIQTRTLPTLIPPQKSPDPLPLPQPKPEKAFPEPLRTQIQVPVGDSDIEKRFWKEVIANLDRKNLQPTLKNPGKGFVIQRDTLLGEGGDTSIRIEFISPQKGIVWSLDEELTKENYRTKAIAVARRINASTKRRAGK